MTTPLPRSARRLFGRTSATLATVIVTFPCLAFAQDGAGYGPPPSSSVGEYVTPASFSHAAHGHMGFHDAAYAMPPAYMPPHNTELIPQDPFHDPAYPDPAHDLLKDIVRNSWFRLEYIQWSLRDPGPDLLGADVSGIVDPEDPFLAGERSTGDIYVGKVATLREIDLENQPGIRGTLGIEMNDGTLEWATWYLAQHTQTINEGEFFSVSNAVDPTLEALGVDRAIYIPLLVQGQIPAGNGSGITTSPVLAFDTSFRARLETSMFGTEANYVWNFNRPSAFWHWRPSVGFRYVNLTEDLGITGATTIPDEHVTTIDSKSVNNMFGPQAGIRAELRHEWFTVSVEPKLTLASNRQSSKVKTNDLFDSTTGFFETEDQTYEFSPMFNVAVQGRIHLRERMSVYVGYDLLFIHRVSRPFDNITYNDNGSGTAPDVSLDQNFTDFLLQGLSLGGELEF